MFCSRRFRLFSLILILAVLACVFVRFEKRVLIIAPAKFEETLCKQFPYTCYFYPLPNLAASHYDLQEIVDEICNTARLFKVDGIVSGEDYAGAALASICSQKLGLVAPDPESVLTCQHKYYSRLAQKAAVPEATATFSLGPNLPYPYFVKPIKSSFSRFARKVYSSQEILEPPSSYFDFFDQLIAYGTAFQRDEERMLAEELLQGQQGTWEGFVCGSEVQTIGIVDSYFHPGTISFQRFQYPSKLRDEVQRRIELIAKKVLNFIGLDNTVCNIEYMYDPEQDRISIIEINPRYALQFCDLYEKVDGTNSYELVLAIATGQKPKIQKKRGHFNVAASFVLRRFEDCTVLQVPSLDEINRAKLRFPDALIFVDYRPGQKLSDILQDGCSYRYGLIHLGGHNEEDLLNRYEECKNSLTFTFQA